VTRFDTVRALLALLSRRERLRFVGLVVLMVLAAALEAVGLGVVVAYVSVVADPAAPARSQILRRITSLVGLGMDDLVIIGGVGLVAVFVAKNGLLLSPPKSNLILPGITYDVVVEIAQMTKIPLEFRDVAEAEVRGADEVWVTSSSKEILAVVTLDGKPVGEGKPGPLFRKAWQAYQEFKAKVMRKEAVSA